MKIVLAVAALIASTTLAPAQHAGHETAQPSAYAGEETRPIKSLSDEDIAELRSGGGWGLAKAAELNGVPGPAHLLELKEAIPLDSRQVAAIETALANMRARAIAEGESLIARERDLDVAFQSGDVTDASLRRMLTAVEESRKQLRYIHLSMHLTTPDLLSEEQIQRYSALRGYGLASSGSERHDQRKRSE